MRGKNKTHRRINSNVCYTGSIVYAYSVYTPYPTPRARARPRVFPKPASHFIHFLFTCTTLSLTVILFIFPVQRARARDPCAPCRRCFCLIETLSRSSCSIPRVPLGSSCFSRPVPCFILSSSGSSFCPLFPGPFCPLFLLPLFTP